MIPKEEKLNNLQETQIKNQTFKLSDKNTVDINILLNSVRASEKKQKLNTINIEFDNIYSISACYIFSDQNLEKFFINVHKMLKKNGILILDFGGGEDNLTSFFFIDIYLVIEAYLIYYLSKLFNKKIGFAKEVSNSNNFPDVEYISPS